VKSTATTTLIGSFDLDLFPCVVMTRRYYAVYCPGATRLDSSVGAKTPEKQDGTGASWKMVKKAFGSRLSTGRNLDGK
jgi:hypothetical protein